MKKRITGIALSICLFLGLMPMTAFGAENGGRADNTPLPE